MGLDYKDSKCRVGDMIGVVFRDETTGELLQGHEYRGETILRFRDGMLHGDGLPAIEFNDGHMEYFTNGVLHREGRPAIIHTERNRKIFEYWENGEYIETKGKLL